MNGTVKAFVFSLLCAVFALGAAFGSLTAAVFALALGLFCLAFGVIGVWGSPRLRRFVVQRF